MAVQSNQAQGNGSHHTVSFLRPFLRRRLRICFPVRDAIRFRKPCFLFPLTFVGVVCPFFIIGDFNIELPTVNCFIFFLLLLHMPLTGLSIFFSGFRLLNKSVFSRAPMCMFFKGGGKSNFFVATNIAYSIICTSVESS